MITLYNLLSPISVAFGVIILGYYLGKIKMFGIALDLSGVLIIAVAVGWILTMNASTKDVISSSGFQITMEAFSSFGTSLFVSVIGITTGYSLDFKKKSDIKAALIGSLMIVCAFSTMKLIGVFDKGISTSELLGALCGALTTTPGLSAVCELESIVLEEAMVGYGCAYIFGVIFTVLFVQTITKKSTKINENNMYTVQEELLNNGLGSVIQIGFAILLGRLFGNINFWGFSIGNSGGVLCVGIVIGVIIKKWLRKEKANQESFNLLRDLGLVLFFVGKGIPAGMRLGYGFEIKMVLYGAIMTMIPIFAGALLYKIMFTDGLPATIISGGMTSTPAISVLLQKRCNIQLGRYSLAYAGALITIIFLIRLLF